MKRIATQRNPASRSNSRRYSYQKALDARKHPIRGLWKRNGQFVARITVEDDAGRKAVKWVPLEKAQTVAQAQEEFRKLLGERSENRLRHIGRAPTLADYAEQTYKRRLATSGKKADTHTLLRSASEAMERNHRAPVPGQNPIPSHHRAPAKAQDQGPGQPDLQFVDGRPEERLEVRQNGRIHQDSAGGRDYLDAMRQESRQTLHPRGHRAPV